MADLEKVDVAIVGGGWTGLLMAKEIATRTSLSVLVLERGGPARSKSEYATEMDELDNEIRYRMVQNIADVTVTHRHTVRDHAAPIRQYGSFHPGTGVGGAGEHWGAISTRFLPEEFTLATHLREKYGSAKLPDDLAVQDWGVTYDDLEPDYWRAEQMMGVCGKAGNLRGKLVEGGNPAEGWRSHEYPNPPHPMTTVPELFRTAAMSLGYHPFPIPTSTLSQGYRNPDGVGRSPCMYCGHCTFYGCMVGAKAQPSNTLLPVLAHKQNFTLRTNCWVRRVIHRDGKAVGVAYTDASGKEVVQPAGTVILSSWTLNNVRLLLMSRIGDVYDAATGTGTLGKNLTQQIAQDVELFFDKPLNGFMGAGGLGMSVGEFAGDPPDSYAATGAFRGGTIHAVAGGQGAISSFGKIPPGQVKSNWGSEWKKAALDWQDKVFRLTSRAMHFSYRHNFVDLDPTYVDKFGDPLLRLTLDWTDHERREAAMLAEVELVIAKAMKPKAVRATGSVGAHYSAANSQSDHIQGGAIMGDSPEKSVVNPWLQHWRMPNLWVVGGSCFPQNEATPTLTINALAYRAADAFIDHYIKRPGALA
jgi:gluconate 2-dehydrogenase alpha chain